MHRLSNRAHFQKQLALIIAVNVVMLKNSGDIFDC